MKAITTCNASLVAGTLAGDAQASWKDLRCGCFLEFGLLALGKTFEYSLQMSARTGTER